MSFSSFLRHQTRDGGGWRLKKRAQATALGLPDFEVILVEHPIQPLTAQEVHGRADAVFAQLLTRLTGGPAVGLRAAG